MAGIGKYTKGKKFELKSGNTPVFKLMAGESPITSPKNTSPYQQNGEDDEESGFMKGLKKVGKVGVAALTGGLDAVYGSGKIISSSSRLEKKDEPDPDDETPEERATRLASKEGKVI